MNPNILQVRSKFKLISDWNVELEWTKRNLVLLREFKLTGMKETKYKTYRYLVDSNGQYILDIHGKIQVEEVVRRETVANPLFKHGDKYTPAQVTLPAGLTIELTEYKVGYRGAIREIHLKIVESPEKRLKDRVLSVSIAEMNKADIELINEVPG